MRKRMWVVVASPLNGGVIELYIVKARSQVGAENFVSRTVYASFYEEGKKLTLDAFREAFKFRAHRPVAVLDAKEER